jgi:hypothetical protein
MWAEPSSPTSLGELPARLSVTPMNLPECSRFLSDDEWFFPVGTPLARRVRHSLERVTDAFPELFNLDVVLSRRKRRQVN